MSVTFNAQFGDGSMAMPQAAFAAGGKKFTREAYGMTEPEREALYVLEVCSGAHALDLYPDQISAALPPGRNINEFFVAKPGCTLDEKERIGSNRTKLGEIFPGCDPRPIHSAAFPGITKKHVRELETSVFKQEFGSQRIAGIVHKEEEQAELYLFECSDAQTAKNGMNLASYRYIRSVVASANAAADAHKEAMLKLEQKVADLQDELVITRKAALQVMPPETAKVVSTFWRMD